MIAPTAEAVMAHWIVDRSLGRLRFPRRSCHRYNLRHLLALPIGSVQMVATAGSPKTARFVPQARRVVGPQ